MSAYCKVLIESPLPQLGREFDYRIPEGMQLEIGTPVAVPFGRQAKPKTAIVTELSETSEYASAEIIHTLGPKVLSSKFLSFIKAVAKRQAISPGELLRSAVTIEPKRMVEYPTAEPSIDDWVLELVGGELKIPSHLADIVEARQHLVAGRIHPQWAIRALQSALSARGGVIIDLPDHRHIKRFRNLVSELDIEGNFYWADEFKTPARRFWLQQRLLNDGGMLVGSRSVMMMDVKNLERILLISDLDPSHESESSPYLSTRELAFIRAEAHSCQVHVISHMPSAEILRLADMGHLELHLSSLLPRVSFGSEAQISTLKLINDAIESGPVLVLTNYAGDSASVRCKACRGPGRCSHCGGSIHMPTAETYRCRTCDSLERPRCVNCASKEFEKASKGIARTAADFGKMIPGVRVIESSQTKQVESIEGVALVVATPGAIPLSKDGYQLVVVDQPQGFLSRESLRALEHSLRIWLDAASHLATDGLVHFANYEGNVIRKLSIGQIAELVRTESEQRRVLGLAPWRRLGIVEGEAARLNKIADSLDFATVIATHPRLVFSYQYKDGGRVAAILYREQLATPPIEGKRRKRGLRVIMDGQGLI